MKLSIMHTLWAAVVHSAVQQTNSLVSNQRISSARDATDDNAAPSSAFMKRIKPYYPDIARSKRKPVPDAGILIPKKGTPSRRLAANCSEFVECDYGYVANGTSCKDVCDELCCVGVDACDYFTGKVCKDEVSCFGFKACYGANIGEIVEGCNGTRSCYYAGKIEEVYNSCLGERACTNAAYRGNIESISSSCNGPYACYYAASYGGNIGSISSSCNGTKACYYAAACDKFDDPSQCFSNITEILHSCDGDQACFYAAYDNGYIGGVRYACNAEKACLRAGQDSSISSGLEDCCNEVSECENATTLPATCGETTAPTSTPSSTPTTKPSPTLSSKSKTSKSKTSKSKTSKSWRCK